ncbi:disease resistance protein RGA2-like isoform X2 [Silene latifolia]
MSREVKRIRKRLDGIVANHTKFGFKFDVEPIRRRGEETCSYVYAPDVVGRKDDLEFVLNKILDLSVEGNIGFVTIVGVGGLGKTTLAQLVYNDERVKCVFSLRLWVCVSDQGGKEFDVKYILSRILESAGCELDDGLSKERVQTRFQEELGGKKCLLVLDDVWNEDCYKWRELRGFLMRFGRGSRIILTSRSKESARIIGNDHSCIYELGGLSEENSWCLFELTAFGKGHGHVDQTELVEIGRNIVKQCCNVPLAIKVVGSLLFGQHKSKWEAFEKDGLACLAKTSPDGSMITSILKLSYDNLHHPLKTCFRYCAVFQKGYRIRKEMLISLWMAQGYIQPFYAGQDMEEAADDLFSILLRRCFFQDVRMDEHGDVKSCKMHDLMHDLAQQVAGDEVCAASSMRNDLGDFKTRHLYEDRQHCEEEIFGKSKIRSYLQLFESIYDSNLNSESMLKPLLENWVCLRTLTLHHSSIKRLPDAIGKLIHLRNLDLHGSRELVALPNSITRLYNLQTLILANCESLKELPKDFSKLVNIRHLDIRGCRRLTNMPIGLHRLACLTILTAFYVGMTGSSETKQSVGQLRDLIDLKNLKGGIEFIIPENYSSIKESNKEGDILAKMEHLKSVQIQFKSRCGAYDEDKRVVAHEYLIEELQPHPNLKGFELRGYQGQTIPIWGNAELNWVMFLPNLVKIQLENCFQLKELPLLCELQHLRSLELSFLYNVEYMEEYPTNRIISNGAIFFPSLKYLKLYGMLKLKAWWKREESWLASFPRLSKLKILHCPNLIAFPSSPTVETLELREVNERLKLITQTSSPNSKVKEVKISHVADLRALPPCHPTSISITAAWAETFSGASEVFKTRGSTSLRHLQIESCGRLKSLSGGGFEHLTVLESLDISYCHELSLTDADNGKDIPWRLFGRNLRSIKLSNLENMRSLPIGMQDLTSLRHLTIEFCENFRGLPEWISKLASLESLVVICCSEIKSLPEAMWSLTSLSCLEINPCSKELLSRCNGVDWPKIQHISNVSLYTWDLQSLPEAMRNLNRPHQVHELDDDGSE